MNRGIGVATLGATLLAGMMFQTRTVTTSNTNQRKDTNTAPAGTTATAEGPWIASCSYWSAAPTVDDSGQVTPPPDVTIAEADGVKLELKASEDNATCGRYAWNIPTYTDHPPEISAVIATVPDPIHSHLALDFDRSIDAILLAAADNHYLSSSYWLPWRSQISTSSTGESAANASKPTAEDNAREHQPGLIILRYAPDASEWESSKSKENGFAWTNYRRVIYLFLVAETPALGVNGYQLQNAFRYEKTLKDIYKANLSIRPWSPQAGPETNKLSNATDRQQATTANQSPAAADAAKIQQKGATNEKKMPALSCRETNPTKDYLSIIGPFYSGSASSLHAGIEAALPGLSESCVSISGATGTTIAVRELDPNNDHSYRSFGENTEFEQYRFLQSLAATNYDLSRVAVLSEAGTVFGSKSDFHHDVDLAAHGTILNIRFPRELSLLRNAEPDQASKSDSTAPPTPYLNLSLKDYTADDTVPRFSTNQSPLSVEAQLMAIAHQIQRARSQFILISASNVLDDIFLAQFLHRACPNARIVVFSGGDLLFERDGENSDYIGSISISPYLLSSLDFGNRVQWLHADYQAEAIYNAASFTFWNSASTSQTPLAGYRNYPVPDPGRHAKQDDPLPPAQFQQIPLWAAVIGADGYYPLAILTWCGSDLDAILPTIIPKSGRPPGLEKCDETKETVSDKVAPKPQHVWKYVPESINENSGISPSLLWGILACFISLACIGHCVFLLSADLWSPFTRDLAIDQNDLPYRRSVLLNIGTSVLAAVAFVTAYPLLWVGHYFPLSHGDYFLPVLTIVAALCSCICTGLKTWHYFHCPQRRLYTFFNVVALAALIATIGFWIAICGSDNLGGSHSYAGLYFSYRCLQPLSGVCPLLPILLLLFAWYLWSIYQTARLRFSEIHRPRIARLTPDNPYLPKHSAYPLFVPDNVLESCTRASDNWLYENITCLLISREVTCRVCAKLRCDSGKALSSLANWVEGHIDQVLGCIYFILFCLCIFESHIHSLDHFLFRPFIAALPTLYEFLITVLFFPLIMVTLSGWLRVILIWGAVSRGLLEPLERMPIRFAFSRYKGGGWMSMLRQKGLHIRWRDMGRSTESIRQIVHHPGLDDKPELHRKLLNQYAIINARIRELVQSMNTASPPKSVSAATAVAPIEIATPMSFNEAEATNTPDLGESWPAALAYAEMTEDPCRSSRLWDLPQSSADLCSIFHIEQGYARFCTILLEEFLAPYWDQNRTGFVEEDNLFTEDNKDKPSTKENKNKPQEPTPSKPSLIQLAEELIVIRYVALIRAVLINIRYLMLFVSAAFVLALIAWNSYPFQPHAFIDWCFTILLSIIGLGFVWVFAQMHRNAILSRITDTTANELGWDFYLRIAAFGAVPILTWLAYQFPAIGGSLYKIIQPGLQVVK